MAGTLHRRFDPTTLAGDLFAGLTLWAVYAAQGLAYSRLAHATPTAGLVTAIAGALIYSVLGSSRRVSIGPAGGIAAMVGGAVAHVPPEHLAASLAFLTIAAAALLLVAGLLRITFLERLFPTPVFVGYIAGTGVTILIGQGRDLVSHGWLAFGVGAAAAVSVVLLKRLAPRVPGPFVVLFAATLASIAFGLGGLGVPVIGSALGHFGNLALPAGLAWHDLRALGGPAVSIALITYVDGLANANMLAAETDPRIRPRREYFALGAVNLLSGLWGGFIAGCSTSRSLVGVHAGGKTRLAPLLAGALLMLTALSVVKFLQPVPLAALAGVVFVAAFDLINVARLREFWRLRRADFFTAMIALVGVVALGMIKGVVVGVAAALAETLRRSMYPHRSLFSPRAGEHYYEAFSTANLRDFQDLIVYRFGTPMFFGNAEVFLDDMRHIALAGDGRIRTVIINADALGIPDATARDTLLKAQKELHGAGIRLVFGNVRADLRQALTTVGAFTLIDEEEFIADLRRVRASLPRA